MENEQIIEVLKAFSDSQKALSDLVVSMQEDISQLKASKQEEDEEDEEHAESYEPKELTDQECEEIARGL